MELKKAKKGLKRFCEYEDSVVLTDNALYEYQEMIETVLQELDNSISKNKIKEKIEELKEYIISLEKQQNELISLGGDDLHIREQIAEIEEQIKILEELLEDK